MAKKKDNSGNIDDSALKRAEKFDRFMKNAAKEGYDFSESMKKSTGFIDSFASQIFGVSKSDFFEKVKISEKDFSNMERDAGKLTDALDEATDAVNKGFGNALNSARGKGVKVNESISLMTNQLSKKMPGIAKQIQDAFDTKNLANLSPEAMKQFKKIVKDKDGFEKLNKFFESGAVKDLKKIEGELKHLQDGLQSNGKEVINIGKGLNTVLERLSKGFNLKSIWEAAQGFDQTIVDAQRNSGLFLASTYEASAKFAELTSNAQQFGMSMKDTTELMGTLGATLRTTDVNRLSEAAGSMAAIKNATGLAVTEVGELGGQMMLMGSSSKEVSKFAESTMKSAMNFGVNGKKVMQDIVKNLPKFRQMGFQGGEESLKRMALQAERMGQNIDEIFDMSKKARNIEGALDMASQLQLAGGSFANINPMDLLSAARKGPEELQKILGQMGGDIGKFDKATGKMAFDAVDYDRLQMVADATGMSVDSLQKQITTMNQDAQKTELIPAGLFDGLGDEEKSFLLNNIGKDGKISMSGGIDGVTDLNSLTKDNIKAQLETQAKEKGTLEEQAKQNTSFNESIANLKGAIMNLFVFFEPFIKMLTSLIQKISGLPIGFKIAFALLLAGLALVFSAGKQVFNGMMFRKGFDRGGTAGGGGIKEMLGFGKKGGATGGGLSAPDTGVKGGGGGGGLKGFASAIKGMSKEGAKINLTGIAKLAASIFLLALPIGLLATIFSQVSPALLLAFGGVMIEMALAMFIMSKITGQISIPNVLKGALAMVIMGAALIPFAFAMQMFAGVSWETLAIAAVAIVGAALLLAGLGFLAPFILMGALTLAAAGVALMVFGASMFVVSAGFEAITKIDWSALSGMGPALLTIAAAGALGMVGTFGLLGMSFALGALAAVMVVLAPAMQMAAQSTNSMAEGIGKLKEAVKGLDVDKLNSMANAAERLSTASAVGGLASAVSGMFGGGAKESKEQTVKIAPITINLKMNGRDLQQIIVEDNKLSS